MQGAATVPAADLSRQREVVDAFLNGPAGIVAFDPRGRPFSVMGFTVRHGRIIEIDVLADPARLPQLDLGVLNG